MVIGVTTAAIAAAVTALLLPLLYHRSRFAFLRDHRPVLREGQAPAIPGERARLHTAYSFKGDWQETTDKALREARALGFDVEWHTPEYLSLSTNNGTGDPNWSGIFLFKNISKVVQTSPHPTLWEREGWIYVEIVEPEPEVDFIGQLRRFFGL
jgi:hypothetical protein